MKAYLLAHIVALQRMVEKPPVDDGDQRMALDMRRKVEVSVRLLDVPLLLEFGGGFAIVYESQPVRSR